MNNSKVDIKAESFPWQAKFLGIVFVIGGMAAATSIWWLSVILFLIALFLLTGHSGTIINPAARTYREYNSYFFIKNGKTIRFERIEKIFINASSESQTMHPYHMMYSSTVSYITYNSYLKLDNGKKIFLTRKRDKKALINLLKPVSELLKTELVDYSG
jgi:hypothetical protein